MSTEVTIPKLGLTMESAVLSTWHVADGDTVSEGQLIADIGTDKIDHGLEAPAAGVIGDLRPADPEAEIPVGATIAVIN